MWRSRATLQALHKATVLRQSCRAASGTGERVMAIRREDVNVWEGRAPLAPRHVRQLVKEGVKVLVQPSNRRAYTVEDYQSVGALIQEDIREASVIIGVKQAGIDTLIPNKTYCFFSHTIKAQDENMPLLDAILEKNVRLIDYEKMVDARGQRVVAFGQYAGVSGMINILHGIGLRLLAMGHHTPFLHIGLAHNYRSTTMAYQAVRDIGYTIALGHMPRSVGPLIFVFTGSGNVSQGAQEVFNHLPHEYVEPEHLANVARHGAMNKVYGCIVSRHDHYVRKDGSGFDPDEFDAHPERYISTFSQKIAPYATCIINGIYYAPNSPRLLSIPEAKTLLQRKDVPWIQQSPGCPTLPHRLIAICDISADPGGSIEFMEECTTIDRPFCLYDAEQHKNSESFDGDGVVICSIEQLPAQIPIEATNFFGEKLLPWIPEILKSDATKPFDNFDAVPVVKGACIASNGELAPNYNYISDLRIKKRNSDMAQLAARTASKKVLLMGSGFVSEPAVEYLTRDETMFLTIASNNRAEAEILQNKYRNVEMKYIDMVEHRTALEHLVKEADLCISLLPQQHHVDVANMCIQNKTNMLTSSYVSPEMRSLDERAKDAGITLMNEMGLDPGIDHLLAMECFDEIWENGGKITKYVSFCGGLPSPELSNTPLRYKFSWSPVGVLSNAIRPARYLENNKVVDIPAGGSLLDHTIPLDMFPGFNLEGIPNRDSTVYRDIYDIQSAHTVLRGSIRFMGYTNAVKGLVKLGLISPDVNPMLHPGGPDITWREFLASLVGKPRDIFPDTLKHVIFNILGKDKDKLNAIVGLGLLDDEVIEKKYSPVETLAHKLNKELRLQPGERDLVILQNLVEYQYPNQTQETRDVRMVVYGDSNGFSAMSKCVGYTCGISAKMMLEGEIQDKGVLYPRSPSIYRPVLQRLKQEGITYTSEIASSS